MMGACVANCIPAAMYRIAIRGTVHSWGPELSSLDPRASRISAAPPVAELPPLIELDRATVVRGQVKVLHGLSLRIAQGQHTALLGPNGCGKSTFIKLITRELYPLAMTGALSLRERAYAELSAGETRRVLIARALVNRPQALLLDEPSTGLDLVAREQLVATMRVLAQQGITLVLVTHHIEEIIPEIERVVLLRDGRVLADGTRAELLRNEPLSAVFGGAITVCEQEGRLTAYAG